MAEPVKRSPTPSPETPVPRKRLYCGLLLLNGESLESPPVPKKQRKEEDVADEEEEEEEDELCLASRLFSYKEWEPAGQYGDSYFRDVVTKLSICDEDYLQPVIPAGTVIESVEWTPSRCRVMFNFADGKCIVCRMKVEVLAVNEKC